jgi:hypothetical protein
MLEQNARHQNETKEKMQQTILTPSAQHRLDRHKLSLQLNYFFFNLGGLNDKVFSA